MINLLIEENRTTENYNKQKKWSKEKWKCQDKSINIENNTALQLTYKVTNIFFTLRCV